jgi:acyl-CoA synthetase (AMP-forming)/AMP-acid ligase II
MDDMQLLSKTRQESYDPCDVALEREVQRAPTVVDVLRMRSARHPERVPITYLGDNGEAPLDVSFAVLDRSARRVAAMLQNLEQRGERVLLALSPGPLYNAAFWGCLYAGSTAVPVYPPFSPVMAQRVENIARDCGARVALTDTLINTTRIDLERHAPLLTQLRWIQIESLAPGTEHMWSDPRLAPDDMALLQYTSGSTAQPKGVMVSHRNMQTNMLAIVDAGHRILGLTRDAEDRRGIDRGLSWLPPYHDMGLSGMLTPVIAGAYGVLCSPTWFIRRPERWLRAISATRARISAGPNFAYEMLIERAHMFEKDELDLSCWKMAINGAEPVRHDTIERFSKTFARWGFDPCSFTPSYGMAEATLLISMTTRRKPPVMCRLDKPAYAEGRLESSTGADALTLVGCGQSHAAQTVIIVDPETRVPCAPNRVGEIWVKGDHIAGGYWNQPDLTRQTFQAEPLTDSPAVPKGPYLRTGDLGFWNSRELFIAGRIKDTIIIRGKNYHPADLERTAERALGDTRRPSAAFCVAEGAGERLVLVQEGSRNADLAQLGATVRQALLREHGVHLSELMLIARHALPRTSSGKVQRRAAAKAFSGRSLKSIDSLKWPTR